MSGDSIILLISDRPDRSQKLAGRLGSLCACRTFGLYEQERATGPAIAVVIDVALSRPTTIERLRQILSTARTSAAPIIAILRDNSRLEHVQAAAIGATSVLPASLSLSHIFAALAPIIRSTNPRSRLPENLTPAQNIAHAGLEFQAIFGAAARGEAVSRTAVSDAARFVMAAIAEGGIRRWLEVVWTYDDTTYQHCMLVTGLAAEFAAKLGLRANDQKSLVRGALLHDVGKAKIPLAILNKPAALTADELTIMRTHAGIGYELLREQGDYEPELLEVVLRHHELLDGSGYPDGLAGPQVADLVRLVTICDIYAALIERRPYRRPMEPALAFKILQEMEGKLEGPLIRAFERVVDESTTFQFA